MASPFYQSVKGALNDTLRYGARNTTVKIRLHNFRGESSGTVIREIEHASDQAMDELGFKRTGMRVTFDKERSWGEGEVEAVVYLTFRLQEEAPR
jgi:hypothetical protein